MLISSRDLLCSPLARRKEPSFGFKCATFSHKATNEHEVLSDMLVIDFLSFHDAFTTSSTDCMRFLKQCLFSTFEYCPWQPLGHTLVYIWEDMQRLTSFNFFIYEQLSFVVQEPLSLLIRVLPWSFPAFWHVPSLVQYLQALYLVLFLGLGPRFRSEA